MGSAVEVENAIVVLGRFPALAGLDLSIDEGSVVLVQGPNGAGKTTLLRLLAGLVAPAEGAARVLGNDVVQQRQHVRRMVGLLGPTSMLYGDLTVQENLEFWASLGQVGAVDGDAILERLGIGPVASQRVSTLSTGQLRRASIAVTVAKRPRLWLLDEPHAGLDQAGRNIVDQLITDAVQAGATIIAASHEQDRVRPLATHIVTVAGGVAKEVQRIAAGQHEAPIQPNESGL